MADEINYEKVAETIQSSAKNAQLAAEAYPVMRGFRTLVRGVNASPARKDELIQALLSGGDIDIIDALVNCAISAP